MTTILFVEDDPITALLVDDALQNAGHDVIWASDAHEAIAYLQTISVKLTALLTDVNLGPGPDGFEIARLARARRAALPVIYVTGQNADEFRRHRVPFSTMVAKPFVADALVRTLDEMIAAREDCANELAA